MNPANPLPLVAALTARTNTLCLGLESGAADILNCVTPTTATLLHWWFGEEMVNARGSRNFHAGQKQAILNAIVAHEVLGCPNLLALYKELAPEALLHGNRLNALSKAEQHPKYAFKMATGTGKTWVLQALLIWQLLNKNAALAEGIDEARFTRHFMLVAPGLIVYERLLDAFCGKEINGARDFATSDVVKFSELFIPDEAREAVFSFVRGNVCRKDEIGIKTTANGMIGVANWHLLMEGETEYTEEAEGSDEVNGAMAVSLLPENIAKSVLPLTPGRATGNSLDVLDKRYARGNVLSFLAELPELLVFNDEAHHIHEIKKEGDATEVEWQKSLSRIAAGKGARFVQMDFSATPYNDVGSGKKKQKRYFDHIITNFDLKSAMRAGLVKALVLDRRKDIGVLPLEFKADRDADGNVSLSEGQRVMLQAGLQKLRKLESDFAQMKEVGKARHPKMLVVCENTKVSPLVAEFFVAEGLSADEVMSIDSGKKAALSEKDWGVVREHLFNVDQHASPSVIVSVLMLREGFDVNNICVIVPLRASQAQILLEQTIGRGLRLMWREEEFADIKRENRERINRGQEPGSLLDVLSIIEHPAFQSFYDELISEGLAAVAEDGFNNGSSVGDMLAAGLCDDFAEFDFGIPFVVAEADEVRAHATPDVSTLTAFNAMSLRELKTLLGKGDQFISHDLQSTTLFGAYRVDGAAMNVSSYNDYLARLTLRISQVLSHPLPKKGSKTRLPYWQTQTVELTGWLDDYIWLRLFTAPFNPLEDENWRVLLLSPVVEHLVQVFSALLLDVEATRIIGETEVRRRFLSEVKTLPMRESCSTEVKKCIYTRMNWPATNGGLEKKFIFWAQADASIEAFCKISETRHDFARLRYLKDDGLPAFYCPDFLVRTKEAIYLIETKAQNQMNNPNVLRKRKAALVWCERINALSKEFRENRLWHYVLLGERDVQEYQEKGALLNELLQFARICRTDDQPSMNYSG